MSFTDIFKKYRFTGPRNNRSTDQPEKEIIIDYSESGEKSVALSLDCYVSGQYVGRKGEVIEARFRFTTYVKYSESTLKPAMEGVRHRITEEFKKEFPSFEPSIIFVDESKWVHIPERTRAEDMGFYQGGELYKRITGSEIARYEIESRKEIYKTSVDIVKKRYGIR